jgi:folate-binding protein YgfZ
MKQLLPEYEALTDRMGLIVMAQRTQIELCGADRIRFLHNLCTNDIRKLSAGQGCEAFLTTVQGKILGHVLVFCQAESLIVDTVPGQAEKILAHCEKYLIRDDVQLVDHTAQWSELLVAGPAAAEQVGVVTRQLPRETWGHVRTSIGHCDVSLRRAAFTRAASFLISLPHENVARAGQTLVEQGAVVCSPQALEIARVEAGFPWYGQDITEANLPQEVGRDKEAISFTKGCYLGQETVARIDALGHVNRRLTQVRFTTGPVPSAGDELRIGEQRVGRVTSAVYSPKFSSPLALAYVRREYLSAGRELEWDGGRGIVLGE